MAFVICIHFWFSTMYYEVMDNLDERSELNGNLVVSRAFTFNTTAGIIKLSIDQ